MEEIKKQALRVRGHGLSVFSTKVDKTPVIKRTNRIVELRANPLSDLEIEIDFSHANVAGIAINCGPVVGKNIDLECLDIDCPKVAIDFLPDLEASSKELHDKLCGCVETTPSEGLHIFYYLPLGKSKCRELAVMSTDNGKKWLAESKAKGSIKKVAPPLIETRGAGGYVVGFYSQAVSKIDGLVKPYKILYGDVSTIPTLTADEHEFLMSFAQSYDQKAAKRFTELNKEPYQHKEIGKKNALDQWREETSWPEILPDSYRVVEVRHDYFLVWHPDSSGREPNAIAGCKNGAMDRYWNFSPLDWRLSANIPLTKDYVYCMSRGWQPGSREWKTFYAQVFSKYSIDKTEDEPINESRWDFLETTKSGKVRQIRSVDIVPDDAISFPGWIDTYIDYCMRNALYPEKRIAAASALGMFSALVGRCIMGPNELKLNLYIVVLGLTASGKDFPRKLNARICMEIDNASLLMTKVGSREGLEEKVIQGPKFLMADEGAFDLEKAKSGDTRFNDVMGTMLELFTSNYIKRRAKAGDADSENFIRYPFLSIMTSSTPEEYFKALSPKMLRSGFYNRLLILQSAIRGRMNLRGMSVSEPIPEYLVEVAARLIAMNENLVPGVIKEFMADTKINTIGNEPLNQIERDSKILLLDEDALQFFQTQVWENDDLYSKYQKNSEEEKASSCARLPELALKIACLWELSQDINADTISLAGVTSGFKFVREVNRRQTANTVMVSDTKFGEITDKLLNMIKDSLNEIEPEVYGVKMIDAKRTLRKIVHSGQSVDDAIRYLQDCGEISIRKSRDKNGAGSMYIVINDQSLSQFQSEELTSKPD